MAEFTLPKNSTLTEGKTYKALPEATSIRLFKVYRWNPDTGSNPRIDTFEVDMDSCDQWYLMPFLKLKMKLILA